MTLAGLAPSYRGRVLVPVLVSVQASGSVDLVTVRLVTGQAPDAFADRTANLAHAFGAQLCRVRDARPGAVTLEFVRADTLADPIRALPIDPGGEPGRACRWAGARTGRRGCCGCSARTC